jgi:hypothetical protein
MRAQGFAYNMTIKSYRRVSSWIKPVEGTEKGEPGRYMDKDG